MTDILCSFIMNPQQAGVYSLNPTSWGIFRTRHPRIDRLNILGVI